MQSCTNRSHTYKINLLGWRLLIPSSLRISPSINLMNNQVINQFSDKAAKQILKYKDDHNF